MAYNKIEYNGNVLIDLTSDDVTAADVLASKYFHGRDGEQAQGSMTNRGAVSGTIATYNGVYTVQKGYHNGNGGVSISAVEQAKISDPNNIRVGCTLLGVTGTYAGEAPNLQAKTASFTPSATAQSSEVTADVGYTALSKVTITVAAIPYTETPNTYGTTVSIG